MVDGAAIKPGFEPRFWTGVNLGITTPGHQCGTSPSSVLAAGAIQAPPQFSQPRRSQQ